MVAVGRGLQRYEGAPLKDVTRESEYALGPDPQNVYEVFGKPHGVNALCE